MSEESVAVKIPKHLRNEFEKLPKKWFGFAEFVRDAVREKLTQEQRFLQFEPDSKDAGSDSPPDKP